MGQYTKDFESWTRVKINLQETDTLPYFYEREIWWASIGHNIGYEEDGKGSKYARPVLVFCKFNRHLFWGIPLSSIERHGKYFYYFTSTSSRPNSALLSQLKAFDSKRLIDRQGMINREDFSEIKKRVKGIIGL